jgi:hypothetical protein
MPISVSFARRQNHDSYIDSICTKCHQTIATADSVRILATAEKGHVCNPNWVCSCQLADSLQGTF